MPGVFALMMLLSWPFTAAAEQKSIRGVVRDASGTPLPGAIIELRGAGGERLTVATTNADGRYELTGIERGGYRLRATLLNFATFATDVVVADDPITIDAALSLALHADVTVTARGAFVNLADVERPEASLIGVAFSSSQGAVTARQIEMRPAMRAGEMLESVPGVIVSQHSGEGKANQYYLRGFNLDHGTDFATTIAGVPVNLPTHGHGHGYSDANFLIPELVSGVQYSKGSYFAEQGDFSAAGSANINYTKALDRSLVSVSGGQDGWARVFVAASPRFGRGQRGHLLTALELGRNDGPWTRPDDYRKINAVVRYSEGTAQNGFSVTGMAYRAAWNSTDQVPRRAVDSGAIGRFDAIDTTDGGNTSRYTLAADWQRSGAATSTRVTAYAFTYGLDLFSNFTYFLDDEENGDQFEQRDRRFVSGGRVSHRRLSTWRGRTVQQTFGAEIRSDDIDGVGLYRTRARARLSTVRDDSVAQMSGAIFYQNQYQWTPNIRTELGVRADAYRFKVRSSRPENSGSTMAGIVSPKASVVLGPFSATEFYVNSGTGFHSNDARGATITIHPATGGPASPVTPLVRATGAEFGVRTVAFPRAQITATLWTLGLESELLFIGDAGTTEASRPSRRSGIELTMYHRPVPWLTLEGDVALSRARFTDIVPDRDRIPGAVQTVVAAGAALNDGQGLFGSARLRYFGPRPLIESGVIRSRGSALVNAQAGYRFRNGLRLVVDVFNVGNSRVSDVDYWYTSRLRGEPPGGVEDVHLHPTVPRAARVGLQVGI